MLYKQYSVCIALTRLDFAQNIFFIQYLNHFILIFFIFYKYREKEEIKKKTR